MEVSSLYERFREMNEKFNVETATTPAESPFSNGIVEQHNFILAEAMEKTIEDARCAPDVALAWAVSAKMRCRIIEGSAQISWSLGAT